MFIASQSKGAFRSSAYRVSCAFLCSTLSEYACYQFDQDIAVSKVESGKYVGTPSDAWSIKDSPNGGYIMAMAINAAKQCIDKPDPMSVTGYYVSKTDENVPMNMDVEIIGQAKSSVTAMVSCYLWIIE